MSKTVKKIESLTPEQKAMIPKYVEMYTKIGLNTEPIDRALAEETIARTFDAAKKPRPKFIYEESPQAGTILAAKIQNKTDTPTAEQIKAAAQAASYGSFEAYWVGFYAFISNELPVEKHELIDLAIDLVKNCGCYWIINDGSATETVIYTNRPKAIHLDDDKKLHNSNGLALEYRDGNGLFCLHGTKYDSMMDMVLDNEFKRAKAK